MLVKLLELPHPSPAPTRRTRHPQRRLPSRHPARRSTRRPSSSPSFFRRRARACAFPYAHPPPGPPPSPHGREKALICGISYKFSRHELKGCMSVSMTLSVCVILLINRFHFPSDSILMLTGDKHHRLIPELSQCGCEGQIQAL